MAISRNPKTGRFEKVENSKPEFKKINLNNLDEEKIMKIFDYDNLDNVKEALDYIASLYADKSKDEENEKKEEVKESSKEDDKDTIKKTTESIEFRDETTGKTCEVSRHKVVILRDKDGNEVLRFRGDDKQNDRCSYYDNNLFSDLAKKAIAREDNGVLVALYMHDGLIKLFLKYRHTKDDPINFIYLKTIKPIDLVNAYTLMFLNPESGFNFTNPKISGNPDMDPRYDDFIKSSNSTDWWCNYEEEDDEEDSSCEDDDECPCVGFGNRDAYCSNKDCNGKCTCEEGYEDKEDDDEDDYDNCLEDVRECCGCEDAYNHGYIDGYKEISEMVISRLIAALSSR